MFKLTRRQIVILLATAVLPGTDCRVSKVKVDSSLGKSCRPEGQVEWATPITKEGLPNFHKVSVDLYRGAQPIAEGGQAIKRDGHQKNSKFTCFSF